MESFFAPVLDGLVETVEKQFALLGATTCDYVYLVGGFSKSSLLQKKIQEVFGKRVNKIITPPQPEAAVLKGAVAFGLNPEIVSSRKARLTYGLAVSEPFVEGVDDESKKFWVESRSRYNANNRFLIYIRAGQSIDVDETVVDYIHPLRPNSKSMSLDIHSTRRTEVRYVDEEGVFQEGTISVKMPDTTGGVNRKVKVTMYFGKAEIKVEAVDVTSGTKAQTSLRFSFTHGVI